MNDRRLSKSLRLAVALCALLPAELAAVQAQTSLCCPADLNADSIVDGADLGAMLGAWGLCSACPEDINGDGEVDGGDLGLLLGAWDECPMPCLKTKVIGSVALFDGTPVADAVVITDQGGSGVSGSNGAFSFIVDLVAEVPSLHVTAVATINGATYTGGTPAAPVVLGRSTNAGVIVIASNDGTPTCDELDWLPLDGRPPGCNSDVRALVVFDDGSGGGPALYAGGEFTSAGGVAANRIARWDGARWSALGDGLNGPVLALAVFDDGSGGGPALYAGGSFSTAGGVAASFIARWDGTTWSPLGSGMIGQGAQLGVNALTVFDDGSGGGPALYAGGRFTTAGDVAASNIARWDGSSWSPLGSGTNNSVLALTVFDDGSGGGPALYAGGSFTSVGGVAANFIARWSGSAWSPLASGTNLLVRTLAVFDDGSGGGPALYAGGNFTAAGGIAANRIARWDGSTWSPLGDGTDLPVQALAAFDDGSGGGPALYAGGLFTVAGGLEVNFIAKWNGSSWSPLGSGMNLGVHALAEFDDGTGGGPKLYAGGGFTSAGGVSSPFIARWNGAWWWDLLHGMGGSVRGLAVFDDGSGGGPALYAGGTFTRAGGAAATRVARWDGLRWRQLGSGLSNTVNTLAALDDGAGAGPALYAGGFFTQAGGTDANRVARWDGSTWSPMGSGVGGTVWALAVYDDGSGDGPAIYAGGDFTTAGGVEANRIAKWNGADWSPLGSGLDGSVRGMAVFDDGSGDGPALYVAGNFTTAGGVEANRIAKWNGARWSPVGSGMNGLVWALTVFDDGSGGGPALHAGGTFTSAGGVEANNIARWDGSSWSPLGIGVNGGIQALTVFDDGSGPGPALYAGGGFTSAGGIEANRIAMWNGSSWAALGGTVLNSNVFAIRAFDDGGGGGPGLYAGGQFFDTPVGESFLIKWGCPGTDGR